GRVALRRPVVEPDPEGMRPRAGQAERGPLEVAPGVKAPARGVGDREVRKVELTGRPRGAGRRVPLGGRGQRGAEEGELEAEVATGGGLEIPGVVPPLGAEVGMGSEIGGKGERARRQRAREPARVTRAQGGAHREDRLAPAALPADARGPERVGDRRRDEDHRHADRGAPGPTHRGAPPRAPPAPSATRDRARPAPRPAPTAPRPGAGSPATGRWAWSSRTRAG